MVNRHQPHARFYWRGTAPGFELPDYIGDLLENGSVEIE